MDQTRVPPEPEQRLDVRLDVVVQRLERRDRACGSLGAVGADGLLEIGL